MKKGLFTVGAVLFAAVLAAPAVPAAEIDTAPVGVYAFVADGAQKRRSSMNSFEQLEGEQEYELYVQKEQVLSVGAAAADKRYHAEFMLPDTTCEVYLTGLTADNVEEIQQTLLDCYVDGQPLDLEDLQFIDAEKTRDGDNDDYLCWAASCSNMLAYTGWGQKAGFQNEDELFDLYAKSFSDGGGFQRNGLAWFFNGVALGVNNGYSNPKVLAYPNSGGYFRNYAYDMVCNYELIRGTSQMNQMFDRLRQGCGVSPGIGIIYQGNKTNGGHAITLWGYVIDTSLAEDDGNRYRAVFITDSDSDMTEKTDRTRSENILNIYPVYVNNGDFCFDYDEEMSAFFEDFTYLLPYSSSVPRERELVTMRDKIKYPDLCFGGVYLSDSKYVDEQKTLYESGTRPYLRFFIENASDKTYRAAQTVSRQVTDQNGKTWLNDTVTVGSYRLAMADVTEYRMDQLSKLSAGDYTVTLNVNEKHPVVEAYYYNNTYTFTFKVRDSYKLGDCNGDGKIDVRDVTAVQRLLSDMDAADAKAAERGNIEDEQLDITDATLLQSYLAAYETDAPIGEKRLHSVI